jgi:signal transduction histidine kinase
MGKGQQSVAGYVKVSQGGATRENGTGMKNEMTPEATTRVMLIEDDPDDHVIIRNLLAGVGAGRFVLDWASQFDAALKTLDRPARWDVYLVDYRLGPHSGVEFLMEGRRLGCEAPMILLTGHDEYMVDFEAMKAGAADYLPKNELTAPLLERSIRYALDRKKAEKDILRARDNLAEEVRRRTEELELTVRALEAEVAHRREAQEELDQKNTELRNFMDVVSHDLKNPLFAIRGFTNMLRSRFGYALGEKGCSHLDVIDSCSRQMEMLVTDLLRLSRIGQLAPNFRKVNIDKVIERVLYALENALREKDVLVVKQDAPLSITCDPGRVHQVFENLISNAIRFVPNAGRGRIDISYQDEDEAHHFSVKDNGPGIARIHQSRIFERFYRIGEGKRGTGLGLAIVKEIVEQHGGTVWVESQEGEGTTFHFTIRKHGDTSPTFPAGDNFTPSRS